jgi:replication factor C subunit 1
MNEKNSIQTPWTLYSKLFGPQSFSPVSGMTLGDKMEVYFQDHQMMPLFVHENYLRAKFSRASGLQRQDLTLKNLEIMSNAADAISDGDLVDRMIHGCVSSSTPNLLAVSVAHLLSSPSGDQQWSLMPVHGIFSCVRPAFHAHGQGGGWPNFPG